MPFNGTGMFVRVRNWVADAAAGIKIRADYHDIEDDGFAAGLSQCIARDGQSTITQNIPMNGKRMTALQDPVDPQDTATKAYADTKLPLAGGTITGGLTVTGGINARGYATRTGLTGTYGANWFNFNWVGGYLEAWIDSTKVGPLATTAYVEQRAQDWAHAIADPKVNRAGDTMTGSLTVNGYLGLPLNVLYFSAIGSGAYLQWQGGANYYLGSGGMIWHSGNLSAVTDVRLAYALDGGVSAQGYAEYGGCVITGVFGVAQVGGYPVATHVRYRNVQVLTQGGWFNVGFV